MSDAIRWAGATKRYGGHAALADVSFAVPGGSIVALLGDNGAGKTTALRLALGLLRPDGGTVETLGMDAAVHGAAIRRRIGYVPERPALYEWMTVAETGWFAAGFGPPTFERRYAELVAGFGLPPERKVRALSKGMRAKVALALALAGDPGLLVMDEPTSGLDPGVRREFLESMAAAAADGRTILLSSHQLHEVERIADRVVVLRAGRVVLDADLAELKAGAMEVVVAFEDRPATGATLPLPAGSLLRRTDRDWQARLLLRSADAATVEALHQTAGVSDVSARPLNLEELYFAAMRPDEPRPAVAALAGG